MCGIAGIVGGVDENVLRSMTQMLHHRGPDDGAIWISRDNDVGLGHRRLNIIDLTKAGRQPMVSHDSRFILVYNGEIYNYKNLRNQLIDKGYKFNSETDSEVLLNGYSFWGKKILEKIHGQFSFSIWDRDKKILFAARDRFGIKPFYYLWNKNKFYFASEIKSFLAIQAFKPELNQQALSKQLAFLWVPHPNTLFNNVYKLPPGHYIQIKDGSLLIEQYWDLQFKEDFEISEENATEKFRSLLNSSADMQMMSDVPIGLLLSGGLDSTTLLAALKNTHTEVTTLTATYNNIARKSDIFEEDLPFARQAAEYFKVHLTELILSSNIERLVETLTWHLDEPLGDPSVITNYLLCKEAKSHLTVLLSGMGADELLAGYPRHVATIQSQNHKSFSKILHGLYPLHKNLGFKGNGKLNAFHRRLKLLSRYSTQPLQEQFLSYSSYFTFTGLGELIHKDCDGINNISDIYNEYYFYFDKTHKYSDLNKLLYVDCKTYLPCLNLENMDKTSMANSVEMRVPFLDEQLVEFISTLPSQLKLCKRNRKYILRKAYKGIIPDAIIKRSKTGFSVPIRHWIKNDLSELVNDTLLSKSFRDRGIFNQDEVHRLIASNISGVEDNSLKLWQLLVFDSWLKVFIESSSIRKTVDPQALPKISL